MRKREVLATLEQARQAQAQALRRFAKVQARLAQLEESLHASSSHQTREQGTRAADPAFLLESGDLEAQHTFAAASQANQEGTEPMTLPGATDPQTSLASPSEQSSLEDTAKSPRVLSPEEQL